MKLVQKSIKLDLHATGDVHFIDGLVLSVEAPESSSSIAAAGDFAEGGGACLELTNLRTFMIW